MTFDEWREICSAALAAYVKAQQRLRAANDVKEALAAHHECNATYRVWAEARQRASEIEQAQEGR